MRIAQKKPMARPATKGAPPFPPWTLLREARQRAGLTIEAFAAEAGTSFGYVSDMENGRRRYNSTWISRFAEVLKCDPSELVERDQIARKGYPLIGKVGAGGEGLYEDDYAMGGALDYIEPLPGMPVEADIIVLETDGDSMAPLVFDGDLAFFGPIRKDVDTLLNKRVLARLADGRKYFKILKRGSRSGLYTLRSTNPAAPDIEDVRVSWVLPYQGSRPRVFV
jgi:transcriptional regulator with XRE-family HTH domain